MEEEVGCEERMVRKVMSALPNGTAEMVIPDLKKWIAGRLW